MEIHFLNSPPPPPPPPLKNDDNPPVDDDNQALNGDKTPSPSSSASSESKKKTSPSSLDNNNNSSSGKRKSTDHEEDDDSSSSSGGGNKKRKTSPPSPQSSMLKMLGPIHLPDFKTHHEIDLHLLQLKSELASTNSKIGKPESKKPSSSPVLLTHHRQRIISEIIRENPTFKPENGGKKKTQKFCRKVYIPVKEYPWCNFVGPIIGPRGQTQKRMQRETGARINVRGRGASRSNQREHIHPDTADDLHVFIEADSQESLDSAAAMVEKILLVPQKPEERKQEEEEDRGNSSLYVANLPSGVGEAELKGLFSCYGEIESTRVMRDRWTGCSRGYGFVNFQRAEGAAMAVKVLNGRLVGGNVIAVRMAEGKGVLPEKKGKMATWVLPPPPSPSPSPELMFQSRKVVHLPQPPPPQQAPAYRNVPSWYYSDGGNGIPGLGRRRLHRIQYPFYAATASAPSAFHCTNY